MKLMHKRIEPGILKDIEFNNGFPVDFVGRFAEVFIDNESIGITKIVSFKIKHDQLHLFPYLSDTQELGMLVSDNVYSGYRAMVSKDITKIRLMKEYEVE